jgi:hypothetical protein
MNEGYGSAANFTHCMIYVLSFESKIMKDLSKCPSVKVSDDDTIKENFLDLNLKKTTLLSFCIEMYNMVFRLVYSRSIVLFKFINIVLG